jgi:integrase
MVRDARKDDLIDTDPFAALDWPDLATPKPDPFTEQERDQILAWFSQHRRAYYGFVFTLFHTGMRPSEMAALRWGTIDTANGTISIVGSRYLGSEGAPKTRDSGRTVKMIAEVCAVLRGLKPLRVGPDDYVFTNVKNGGPINQSEWPKDHWRAALRGTGVRPRKFYATRHTFISIALTRGVNLKWLAEYCWTSVMMIERNYGRFLPEGDEQQLQLLAGEEKPGNDAEAASAKTETPSKGFGFTPKNPGGISVPDGI